jgi:DNA-binding transcriptional LysR family regulator
MPASRPNERAGPKFRLPGTKQRPLPLISYTETSYFGRCQALLLKRTSDALSLRLHYESDMAEVLKKLVMEGEGVAWLPRSTIARELADGELVPAGPASWQLQMELRAYRDSTNRSEFLDTLWHHLGAGAAALE